MRTVEDHQDALPTSHASRLNRSCQLPEDCHRLLGLACSRISISEVLVGIVSTVFSRKVSRPSDFKDRCLLSVVRNPEYHQGVLPTVNPSSLDQPCSICSFWVSRYDAWPSPPRQTLGFCALDVSILPGLAGKRDICASTI
jgi:hypothetical protein